MRYNATSIFARVANQYPEDVEPAIPSLIDALDEDFEYARGNACWALGYLEAESALAALEELRESDSSEEVRYAAEQAVQMIEGGHKTPPTGCILTPSLVVRGRWETFIHYRFYIPDTMPEPAAELVVYFYGSSDESETADEVVRQYEFHPAEVDGSVITMDQYTAYHYQPFEAREENAELLDECVEDLEDKFPEMEVWLRNRPNKDYGSPVSEDYLLYIAPSRDVVDDNRRATSNRDSGSDADQERRSGQDSSSKIDDQKINWKAKDPES